MGREWVMLRLIDAETKTRFVLAEASTIEGLRKDRARRMAYTLEEVTALIPIGGGRYRWTEGKFPRLGTVEHGGSN